MSEQKLLGLVLDSKLSFEKHLNEKIIKANKNLGIIKHLSRFLPLRTLDQMFKVLVCSHLDYCDIIYHVPSKQDQFGATLSYLMEKVERIQYQAALAITGAWQGSNRSKLYDELGWKSLSDRRWCICILKLHEILCNQTPTYLKNKLSPLSTPLYYQNCSKTFRYMNSFFPDATSSWNNVISHFQNVPSLGTFKYHIISLIHPEKKSIFGIHDPTGVRYLFQLRVGLCSLSYHKKRHNFVDTPSNECQCNFGIEDTNHFLFFCLFCETQRATLVTCVNGILQKYNLDDLGN